MTSLTTRDITNKTARFIRALQTAKTLEAELQSFYEHIQAEMAVTGVTKLSGDWGSLTLATRKTWKATKLPPRFYKQTLDTTKLNFLYKSGENLPSGASFTKTNYLSKRLK
jgi:hypothetical protein